jgi:chain length determinant protein tyrosine kinase EpsG
MTMSAQPRESSPAQPSIERPSAVHSLRGRAANNGHDAATDDTGVHDRPIGDLLSAGCGLTAEQIEAVLRHQSERGLRFGEAAVALNLVSSDDVVWALSQQFHYPYSRSDRDKLSPELPVARDPFSEQAEVFRRIRAQLSMRLQAIGRPAALAVLSPDHGDGKSYFAANLAVAFGQLGGKALLVDADLRNARQHEIFGLQAHAGLSSVLSGRTGEILQKVPALPGLSVLPAGTLPPNPLELVERPAFGLLIRELAGKFDHVIVDTPAACHSADAAVIASRCGAGVVLARGGVSRLAALAQLLAQLRDTATPVLGALVNEV